MKKKNKEPAEFKKDVRQATLQLKEEDTRRQNLVIHNVKEQTSGDAEANKRQDALYFHEEIARTCGVAFTPDDIAEVLRMGKSGPDAAVPTQPRPILVKLSAEGSKKKKLLFQNLAKFRDHQRRNAGPEDKDKKFVVVVDDLTEVQRQERKKLVDESKKRNSELAADSTFLWAVRGPPWAMLLKKVEKKMPTQ